MIIPNSHICITMFIKNKCLLLLAFVLMCIFLFGGCQKKVDVGVVIGTDELPVDWVDVTFIYDITKLENVVGYSDYVFIGKVEKYINTSYISNSNMPLTEYSVKVLHNIKGELTEDIILFKDGGISKKYNNFIIFRGDLLPKVGEIYFFSVYALKDGTLRAGSGPSSNIHSRSDYTHDENYKTVMDAFANQNIEIYIRERYISKYDKNY